MKRNGWKKCSYPFDWINSRPVILKDCLKNNFKTFMDKSEHITVKHEYLPASSHITYNRIEFGGDGISPIFCHHDLTIEKDYSYFERCIDRFRDLLSLSAKKLFLIIFDNAMTFIDRHDTINELDKVLSDYTQNYLLCVINHTISDTLSHTLDICNHITYINIFSSTSNGVYFTNNEHNVYLDNIMKSLYTFEVTDTPHAT